ncbi:hypothetical protein CEXT_469151 [Caerostris extrusa]|uniref:Uncharacterized protein n=1 Tax=Caerostris extrusa TaxID=172846 RepID=A0AAV4R833_CAEEX|nr:hypothetical protein CEXT_469151 [Caerostris extrusa]
MASHSIAHESADAMVSHHFPNRTGARILWLPSLLPDGTPQKVQLERSAGDKAMAGSTHANSGRGTVNKGKGNSEEPRSSQK